MGQLLIEPKVKRLGLHIIGIMRSLFWSRKRTVLNKLIALKKLLKTIRGISERLSENIPEISAAALSYGILVGIHEGISIWFIIVLYSRISKNNQRKFREKINP